MYHSGIKKSRRSVGSLFNHYSVFFQAKYHAPIVFAYAYRPHHISGKRQAIVYGILSGSSAGLVDHNISFYHTARHPALIFINLVLIFFYVVWNLSVFY